MWYLPGIALPILHHGLRNEGNKQLILSPHKIELCHLPGGMRKTYTLRFLSATIITHLSALDRGSGVLCPTCGSNVWMILTFYYLSLKNRSGSLGCDFHTRIRKIRGEESQSISWITCRQLDKFKGDPKLVPLHCACGAERFAELKDVVDAKFGEIRMLDPLISCGALLRGCGLRTGRNNDDKEEGDYSGEILCYISDTLSAKGILGSCWKSV